jgi:outer membrane protein assembly factor BamB
MTIRSLLLAAFAALLSNAATAQVSFERIRLAQNEPANWLTYSGALDLKTGRPLWSWKRDIPADYHSIGFGRVNRGPAILDETLYVTTLDGYLVALDA